MINLCIEKDEIFSRCSNLERKTEELQMLLLECTLFSDETVLDDVLNKIAKLKIDVNCTYAVPLREDKEKLKKYKDYLSQSLKSVGYIQGYMTAFDSSKTLDVKELKDNLGIIEDLYKNVSDTIKKWETAASGSGGVSSYDEKTINFIGGISEMPTKKR